MGNNKWGWTPAKNDWRRNDYDHRDRDHRDYNRK
jgi:hypothetical protein